ncbi:MAG: hypothetical protein Q8P41_21890 [Pseudomonadota bacterium]|nr:hypothetical protein [Pseudomonadota bacterium]
MLAPAGDPEASRLAHLLDAPLVPKGRRLLTLRPEVVLVRGPPSWLAHAALVTTLVGAAAVIAVPLGPAEKLPWWERRFHRFLFASQAEARAWSAAGLAMGRLVVVPPGADAVERAALEAAIGEVRSMARRPDARRSAR